MFVTIVVSSQYTTLTPLLDLEPPLDLVAKAMDAVDSSLGSAERAPPAQTTGCQRVSEADCGQTGAGAALGAQDGVAGVLDIAATVSAHTDGIRV